MEKKFNVGDRVRVNDPEWELRFDCGNDIGVVTSEDIGQVKGESFYGEDFVEVAFCDGWVRDDLLKEELEVVESYDPKTAFLSELKGLLEKYGAELGDSGVYEIEGMEVTFDNGNRIRYKHCTINALNIMDYEKE